MSEAEHPSFVDPVAVPPRPAEPTPDAFPQSSFPVLSAGGLEPRPTGLPFPSWNIWDALSVLGVAALTIVLCSVAALGIVHSLPRYRHLPVAALAQLPLVIIGSQSVAYPIVIGLMAVIVRSKTGETFLSGIHWGWPGQRTLRFFASGVALAFAVEGLARLLPIPKSLPMDKFFNDVFSAYLMAFFGTAVAPLLEELFFRGMLYPVLRRGLGLSLGIVVTAAAFAAIHGAQLGYAWAPILSIFLVGIAFTLVREYSDSVAACVLVHCGYNFTLFAVLWVATDHFRHLGKLGS
jgi:membrane protease YdiL (CAAX protease family)